MTDRNRLTGTQKTHSRKIVEKIRTPAFVCLSTYFKYSLVSSYNMSKSILKLFET